MAAGIVDLIEQARRGDAEARERLLAELRPKLRMWAEHSLNSRIAARVDASDITQATLLDLHEKIGQFAGSTEGELIDWLRRVLENNILDAVRQATAKKRHIGREQRIDVAPEDGDALASNLAGDYSTPSMKAIRNENDIRLQEALNQLLPDQQLVVRLVHFQGKSLEAAAQELNRTTAAAAKLLQRGIKNLRSALSENA